ncbi:MAG TPA: cysteine desulfurase NifS [Bacteroidetes bacterium]|nr:cysteine desulfurase NifS [Bacteroidota bacterium]
MKNVYLDYSATTPIDPRVLAAMMPLFAETFGNASSVHAFGREARSILETSRERVARCIGAKADELFFTSGGTESDNYALKGVAVAARKKGKNHIIISAIEHHAVLHPANSLRREGFEVDVLPVDGFGMVDPAFVHKKIRSTTSLVSIMHGNNEVGTIQPIHEIGLIAREHGIVFHSDTVQTTGKIKVDADALGVDLLSLSAHKLYGPKGIGAIYIRKGTQIDSLIEGGAQESNRRAGTENVPLAVGFAVAMELGAEILEQEAERVQGMKVRMAERLRKEFEGLLFNGHPSQCLPNILSVSFDSAKVPIDGEALIMGMDLRGVAVTSGSACTSGSLQPSHVLRAMGRDEKTARATVRFSLGRSTNQEDLDYAVEALRTVVATARKASGS